MQTSTYYRAKQYHGAGWGIEKLTRDVESGKILKREDVLVGECSRNYTMHQAQLVADAENRLI